MVMIKYTQKDLKSLVKQGITEDITNVVDVKCREIHAKGITQIGYSCGVYGCNGMLLRDNSGKQYAIIGRTSAMFSF